MLLNCSIQGIVFILSLKLMLVNSLQCYICHSDVDPNCNDPFVASQYFIRTCPVGFDYGCQVNITTICFKY
jgi:hypothetical protein